MFVVCMYILHVQIVNIYTYCSLLKLDVLMWGLGNLHATRYTRALLHIYI